MASVGVVPTASKLILGLLPIVYYYSSWLLSSSPEPWLPAEEPSPWLADRWRAERLDADGFAWRLPAFLSEDELTHIDDVRRTQLDFQSIVSSLPRRATYLAGAYMAAAEQQNAEALRFSEALRAAANSSSHAASFRMQDQRASDVQLVIEHRMAQVTGLPFRAVEQPIQFTETVRWDAAPSAESSYLPSGNIHHDLNNRPRRAVTLIIYLTGEAAEPQDEEEEPPAGGETIFPCLRPADGGRAAGAAADDEHERACARLKRHFERGLRILTHPASHAAARMDQPGISVSSAALDRVARHVSDACHDPAADERMVRVRPVRGDALLFLSVAANGTELWQSWHAGCEVRRGAKRILQKFKER